MISKKLLAKKRKIIRLRAQCAAKMADEKLVKQEKRNEKDWARRRAKIY